MDRVAQSRRQFRGSNEPIETRLHPVVFRIILGLAIVLVVGIAGFAGGTQQYNGLVLTVAALFVVVALSLPATLWLIGRRRVRAAGQLDHFATWLGHEVDIWQGHVKGGDAAAAVLLPIIAVSVGMVIFALEFHFISGG